MKYIAPLMIIILIIIDQITKVWAENVLKIQGEIELWPGVFHFAYVENTGAAWGMLDGKRTFFIIITVLVLGGIIWFWRQLPKNSLGIWMKIAFSLVISGAIGNLIDRVFLGYVRDMFYVALIDFPVFNIADICVVVGVILLMILIIFGDLEKVEDETLE